MWGKKEDEQLGQLNRDEVALSFMKESSKCTRNLANYKIPYFCVVAAIDCEQLAQKNTYFYRQFVSEYNSNHSRIIHFVPTIFVVVSLFGLCLVALIPFHVRTHTNATPIRVRVGSSGWLH